MSAVQRPAWAVTRAEQDAMSADQWEAWKAALKAEASPPANDSIAEMILSGLTYGELHAKAIYLMELNANQARTIDVLSTTDAPALMRKALEALESCGAAAVEDGGQQWFDDKLVDAAHEAIGSYLAATEKIGGAA